MKAKPPKAAGRPTSYRPTFPEKAEKLWGRGATDLEVSKALGISHESLYQYVKRFPAFAEAQKRGKALADDVVENSLFQRATGFSHPDTHFSSHLGEVTATPFIKHYAPDPVSCIFWLKNRRPDKWRDRTEARIEISEIVGLPKDLVSEIQKRAAEKALAVKHGTGKAP